MTTNDSPYSFPEKNTKYGMAPGGCKGNFVSLIFLAVFTIAALLLTGCYTEKKAAQQTEKAADEYPDVVAGIARKIFPCITKDSIVKEYADSTAYINSRNDAIKKLGRAKYTLDSLIAVTKNFPEELKKVCSDYADIIDEQQKEILNMNGIIETFKPVVKWRETVKYIEDSAKIRLMQADNDKCITELKKETDAKNELQNKYDAHKNKWRGKVGIPWWWLLILAALIGLSARFKMIRFLNPFK